MSNHAKAQLVYGVCLKWTAKTCDRVTSRVKKLTGKGYTIDKWDEYLDDMLRPFELKARLVGVMEDRFVIGYAECWHAVYDSRKTPFLALGEMPRSWPFEPIVNAARMLNLPLPEDVKFGWLLIASEE